MVENVLRLQLRDETSGVHEALHRHPEFIALQAGRLDAAGQRGLMSRIGAFYAALDPRMARMTHLVEDIGYAYRPRSPLFPEISPRSAPLPQIDTLSATMILVVTGVGSLIHIYAIGYMHGDKDFNRFFAYLNLLLFFMLILVTGNNYLMLFVGWEGVGLCRFKQVFS